MSHGCADAGCAVGWHGWPRQTPADVIEATSCGGAREIEWGEGGVAAPGWPGCARVRTFLKGVAVFAARGAIVPRICAGSAGAGGRGEHEEDQGRAWPRADAPFNHDESAAARERGTRPHLQVSDYRPAAVPPRPKSPTVDPRSTEARPKRERNRARSSWKEERSQCAASA